MPGRRRLAPLLLTLMMTAGCAGRHPDTAWGAQWPGGSDFRRAAVSAATSPATWVPLAGAAALAVGDLDDDLSEWGADHAPLFGSDAGSASDDLRTTAKAAWLITALAAPSDTATQKLTGLVVGGSALALEEAVTGRIKDISGRSRPDGRDDKSFTSGHAGASSAAASLARHNLSYFQMPDWLDGTLRVGLHGVALGTGWARVEAERHHVTDVLAGYAVGQFLATFMHEAFMAPALPPTVVHYQPLDGGGAVTVILHRF